MGRTDFGPGNPHDAMDLRKETLQIGGGWILEVDLRKFFDAWITPISETSSATGYVTA